ncbi:MAG: hypothetical protein ACLTYN_12045 [Dysosmobacter welbionis]
MKKRLLSLLCVLVLTVSVIPAASALEGEAARAADTLSTLGLIDSTYNLDAPPPGHRRPCCWCIWPGQNRPPRQTTGWPASGMFPPPSPRR